MDYKTDIIRPAIMKILLKIIVVFLIVEIFFSTHLKAQTSSIGVFVSPPTDNITNVVATTTMGFSTSGTSWASSSGTSIIGIGKYYKIGGTSTVINDDDYGAGTGTYLAISASSKVGLKFSEDKNYFGFAWCAGDADNQIQVYYKKQLLLTYTTANVITFLPKTPNKVITATDNSQYNSSDYYGKFASKTTNAAEPYAYLHIYSSGTIKFDSLVFSQAAGTGTFETDNHSVESGSLSSLPGTWTTVYEAVAGTASESQVVCSGDSPADIKLSGSVGSIQWQKSVNSSSWSDISGATSATLSSSQIGTLTSNVYFRAAVTSQSTTAYSNIVTVTVPIFSPPTKTLADLAVTGTNIKWYDAASGGSTLTSTTTIVSGTTYYASQTVNGVESTSRLAIIANIDSTPCAPMGDFAQTFSAGATVANLSSTGSNIRWYTSASGGTYLDNTTPLISGTTYYASQTVNCTESETRLAVTVTVN